MMLNLQQKTARRLLQGLFLSVLLGGAIACQPQSAPTAAPGADSNQSSPQPNSSFYRSDRFNFQFEYPDDYILIATSFPIGVEDNLNENIEIWSQRDYTSIYAGTEQITELPPNVTITVHDNAQQLGLEDWVREANRFGLLPDTFEASTIADQEALSFTSSGLYENENMVVSHPEQSTVVVISLATIGTPASDEVYRSVFEQILSSFAFNSEQS